MPSEALLDRDVEFKAFPKIPRLLRDMIVTEKLDGTNACVVVTADGAVHAQSRKRLITPEQDNFGFARWVAESADALRKALEPGYHYGEWYGQGIQRGYGLEEKRFALFAVDRYEGVKLPPGVETVPVLLRYSFDVEMARAALEKLRVTGSQAAPGFMDPEGVIVFHTHARQTYKLTFEYDEAGKGEAPVV